MNDVSCPLRATMYSMPIYHSNHVRQQRGHLNGMKPESPLLGGRSSSVVYMLHVALSQWLSHQSGKSMHIFRARRPIHAVRKTATTKAQKQQKQQHAGYPIAKNKSTARSRPKGTGSHCTHLTRSLSLTPAPQLKCMYVCMYGWWQVASGERCTRWVFM